jgi:hypothetical protein
LICLGHGPVHGSGGCCTVTKGIMGAFEKIGLVESDGPQRAHDDDENAVDNRSSGDRSPAKSPPRAGVVGVAPGADWTMNPSSPATFPSGASLSADDEARLKDLEAQVYAAPSNYVTFQRVRESLGNPLDAQAVFRVLAAANPNVTLPKVLSDIDMHLGIVDSKRREFDEQVEQARASRVEGAASEIAALTKANEEALAQVSQRKDRIAELTRTSQDAERAISDGVARFKLVEDQLRAPLMQAKQMLGAYR